MINPELSPYQRLGGEAAIRKLVTRFYELMATLPEAQEILAMHPQDLSRSEDKLFKFLSGWLGGPPLFEQEFGSPFLRARHMPFAIGDAERDAWMRCMSQAIEEQGIEDPLLKMQLLQSLRDLADHMRNR